MSSETEQLADLSEQAINVKEMTVSELFESWIVYAKNSNSQLSTKTLFLYYMAFLKPVFGERYVADIDHDEWSRFIEMLSDPGDTELSRITADSAKRAIKIFHMMFAYGKEHLGLSDPTGSQHTASGYRKQQPKPSVKSPKPPKKPVEYVFSSKVTDLFTDEEIEQMKSHMIWYNNTHICVMLCLYAALSQSEISGLQWGDIDTENGIIHIRRVYYRRTVYGKDEATEMVEGPPKNRRGKRDIPIPEWLAEKLAPIKQVYGENDYVFTGNKSIMYAVSFGNKFFPRFLEWAGVDKPHSFEALKNTYVKSCFDSGMSVERISLLIGDSDMKFTINRHFEIKE